MILNRMNNKNNLGFVQIIQWLVVNCSLFGIGSKLIKQGNFFYPNVMGNIKYAQKTLGKCRERYQYC